MFSRMSFRLLPKMRCLFHTGHVLKSTVEIRMPALSPTMTQGSIIKWHKKEGDVVSPGDLLCEIQTDKAVMAFEVDEEGTLAKILKGDHTNDVTVGTLIALIAEEGTDWKSVRVPEEISQGASSSSSKMEKSAAHAGVRRSQIMGPAAKILTHQYNIDVNKVEHTGPFGILLKSDVMKYIKEKGLKPVENLQTSDQPVKSIRILEAKPLVDSLSTQIPIDHSKINYKKISVPHSYSSVEVCMDSVQKRCEEFKKEGLNVEYLDILVKATAISLKKFPHLNALWNNDSVQMLSDTNVSISIHVDDCHIFQEIKDVASLAVEQISATITNFKEKAISKELPNLKSSSSSIVISYLGNVDITNFQSVVIPPYVSSVSFTAPRFILDENCSKSLQTTISMSVDNRVVDDMDATNFLENMKQLLENPSLMISQHAYQLDLQKLFAK